MELYFFWGLFKSHSLLLNLIKSSWSRPDSQGRHLLRLRLFEDDSDTENDSGKPKVYIKNREGEMFLLSFHQI